MAAGRDGAKGKKERSKAEKKREPKQDIDDDDDDGDVANADADVAGKVEEDKDSGATRALVEALRAFSQPKWWLIGRREGQTEDETLRRKKIKPEEFQKKCEERHGAMRKVYESTMMQDAEQRWLRKVCSDGTSGDKVASLTMLIQVCPAFATGYLKALLAIAGRTARSDSVMALDALKDLFINHLLPDRKLKTFSQMDPVSPKGMTKVAWTELAVVSYFEDYLKTVFAGFIHVLGELAVSDLPFFKKKSIRAASDLLAAKPEQERTVLRLIVNKFGDNTSKVSSDVAYRLKDVLKAHPAMKGIIATEVESFLSRPNITRNAQYGALVFLSEMILSRNEPDVASQLVRIFVAHLELILQGSRKKKPIPPEKRSRKKKPWWRQKPTKKKKKGALAEEDNRLVTAVITGIHRAMPYIGHSITGTAMNEETLNALFKVCHTVSSFSTRIAILNLLFSHLYERLKGNPPNRFYQLLYEQLAEFDLFAAAHKNKAYGLLRRCVPADVSVGRAVALSRRMLQVGANSEAPIAVAAISLLRELFAARRLELRPLLLNVESDIRAEDDLIDDVDEEYFVDDAIKDAEKAETAKTEDAEKAGYDPVKRNPMYAQARTTPLWELFALRNHVHPHVADCAQHLLKAETFSNDVENPFEHFGMGEMLEEFVTSSRAKQLTKHDAKILQDQNKKPGRVCFSSGTYFNRKTEETVPAHERFYFRYFRDGAVVEDIRKKRKSKREHILDFDEETDGHGDGDGEAAEEATNQFFDEYLENQMGDGDDSDEDDVDESEGDEGGGGEDEDGEDDMDADADGDDDPLRKGEGESPEEEDNDENDEDVSEEDEPEPRGKKRKADPQKVNNLLKERKKKHQGSSFASVEDFEDLLDDL